MKLALLLVSVLLIAACTPAVPQIPAGPPQAPPPASQCPSSCDDADACTRDACNQASGFVCVHEPITPCCGNGRCESGESSCAKDCKINAALAELIAKTASVDGYVYTYEVYDKDNAQIESYDVRIAGPIVEISYPKVLRRGAFEYDTVLINQTANSTILLCADHCVVGKGLSLKGTSAFGIKRPAEITQSLTDAQLIGEENFQNKPAKILLIDNGDGTSRKMRIMSFYGVPMTIDDMDANGAVVRRTRYQGIEINTVHVQDIVLPPSLVITSG